MSTLGAAYHLGEVILAGSVGVTAQCPAQFGDNREPSLAPALGSFVCFSVPSALPLTGGISKDEEPDPFVKQIVTEKISPDSMYGVVTNIQTASLDHGRRATAWGISTEEELRQSQPQIFELLTMEFSVALTSFTDSVGNVHHRLPARPPRIHSFVYPCDIRGVMALTKDFGYLRTLLGNGSSLSPVPTEDIVAATVLSGWEAHQFDEAYLVLAGKALLRQLSNDYDRFQSIMQQISSAVNR